MHGDATFYFSGVLLLVLKMSIFHMMVKLPRACQSHIWHSLIDQPSGH